MTERQFDAAAQHEPFRPVVDIEPGFEGLVPEAFLRSPVSYFETHGVNIKQGEIERDDAGRIKEDPTAVKDLPVWEDASGRRIHPVGKRVNVEKGKVAKSGDPFYEVEIMKYVRSKGLPAAQPIAKASEGNVHIIVMENVPGFRWSYRHTLKKNGWTDEEVDALHTLAEAQMLQLQKRFEAEGIIRGWKLSDMIFDIDTQTKTLRGMTPVDWERTKIQS